jgi:hypothetical protein
MTLTGPPSGKDDDTGLGYDDTPAGNMWRQTAGPATPGLPGRVARTCHGHRRLTLSGWAAVAACLIIMWMQFGAPPDNSFTATDPGTKLIN